jgi:hypothetical protein
LAAPCGDAARSRVRACAPEGAHLRNGVEQAPLKCRRELH